jgi:hypothetical protein
MKSAFKKSAASRRGETAGCGLWGFTTWYEVCRGEGDAS